MKAQSPPEKVKPQELVTQGATNRSEKHQVTIILPENESGVNKKPLLTL